MCGFAGKYSPGATVSAQAQQLLLSAMLSPISHRGPDETGYYCDEQVALAHCRLSIVDPAHGQQPMVDPSSQVVLVYNGEVFNHPELRQTLTRLGHQFTTHCDTEVVLRAYLEYGQSFVQHLNGQFAIVIWDPREQQLLLVRDRVGICPLFYSDTRDGILFGSEVKAIIPAMMDSPRLNLAVLDEIFTCWTPLGSETVFANIQTVQPGEMICLSHGRRQHWKYWSFDYSPQKNAMSETEWAASLHEELTDAVRIRLRSDVPVGAYLSGGLDSSIITTLINRLSPERLNTYSLGFSDPDVDERCYQRMLIESLNVSHTECHVTEEDICDAFAESVWHAETPMLRAAPVPMGLLSAKVNAAGFKVVLTGEGADEVFGGYDLFKETKIRQFWSRQPQSESRPLLLKKLYQYLQLPAQGQAEYLRAFFNVMLDQPDHVLYSHMPRWTTTAKAKQFYSDDLNAALQTSALSRAEKILSSGSSMSSFQRAQYIESTLLMPGYLLSTQGDRMLSMHSVEGRFPFLDHRVIELASRLPDALKMKVLNEKYLLKKAFASQLPPAIAQRSKQPYRAPDARLLKVLVERDDIREGLSESRIRAKGLFSAHKVQRLMRKARSKPLNTSESQALIGIISTQILTESFGLTTL
ncbi:asparagine synthase (glutamine-hydrolyzing) [Reinekea blandensis]|uniref:asparagine synthase (glutamine-hydrolyzing) n=1 Tax=Reinekea blandensis MED297 TaxID=314283 RepID=A4BIU0_9GAMM|nr:asparagine synthase (glutamine-hydrolyzing) [Reinekea blandensis]EAR07957.1 putative asparagine synthetase protein [Reinekea sp. MED297] [Reinekea blandensis MED297]